MKTFYTFYAYCVAELITRINTFKKHGNTKKPRKQEIFCCPDLMSDLEESTLEGGILKNAMTSYKNTPHAAIDTLVPLMKKNTPRFSYYTQYSFG